MSANKGDKISLHWLERKALAYLLQKGSCTIQELASGSGESLDQARRAVQWLKEKGIVEINVSSKKILELGPEGENAVKEGLPEKRVYLAIRYSKGKTLEEIREMLHMSRNEFDAALGRAKKLGLIKFDPIQKSWVATEETGDLPEERLLSLLAKGAVEVDSLNQEMLLAFNLLSKRPNMIRLKEQKEYTVNLLKMPENLSLKEAGISIVTPEVIKKYVMLKNRDISSEEIPPISPIDVISPVPLLNPGRLHPLTRLIEEVKSVLISMGFIEISGPLVQPSFWVFDALFTPQDHPARDMQDTLYVQNVRSVIRERELIQKVRRTHENGWRTGSLGWRYQWSENEATRSVLRTHTTALSCRYLAKNPSKESRVFSIGRVFRNENLDSTHLFEFTQIEAVISEKDATARKLLGYMAQFYRGLGFRDIKFQPTYFPYTEPSFEPLVYSEKLGKWIELGGSGMFRPEVIKPLGVKNNVLAWGFGLERIAMVRFGIDDIRYLYENDLGWLRGVPEYP